MGYFPNGTSHEMYAAHYCSKCHHDINDDCPVMTAHLLQNYDECNNPDSILHLLIPRDRNGYNLKCKMFIPRLGNKPL
jgi:hypothetical protein